MELRSLILFGLCVLAVAQCSVARHSMHKRESDDEMFAADEASDDEPQNDFFEEMDKQQESENRESVAVKATILTKPRVYEVNQGEDVRLECNVDPDNGTVVQWSKGADLLFMNSNRMISDVRYNVSTDSKDLFIYNVTLTDRGVFKCEVVQQESVGIEHSLVISAPPQIQRFTATNGGRVIEGQDLYLTCEVTGFPPPQIVWSRDDADKGNRRLGENDGEFTMNGVHMKQVTREYSGKYLCYAFNTHGYNQSELQVFVAGKPRVHVHKTMVNSDIGVEAVLECSTKYDNNPHIRWYKDGGLIEDLNSYMVVTRDNHSNLTVVPKSDSDFGTFTCEASNEHGKHNRSIALVQWPVVSGLISDGSRIRFLIHSHQPLAVIIAQLRTMENDDSWKEVEIPLPSTQSHTYEIIHDFATKNDIAPGKYLTVVKAKNTHSWSELVDPVVVEIEVQPEYIQHASVYRGDAVTVRPTFAIISTVLMYVLVRML